MGKHCIQTLSCSHTGFVAFDAGGTHVIVAYALYGGNIVMTSPLRLLGPSLIGEPPQRGVTKIPFLVADLVEWPWCTCSEAGQKLVSKQPSFPGPSAHSASKYPPPGAWA